jgi:hypothetical protein
MAIEERVCTKCGVSAETTRLEKCGVCAKFFCAECAHRAYGGRKFCSPACARSYYFHGEMDDDDEDLELDDDKD